jgi:LuxR family transcriptional regulator, maltose regulon positive regulatory protein
LREIDDAGTPETGSAATVAPPSVDPFLEAKLRYPQVRGDWVDRARLRTQLEQVSDRPVMLISAAAGYGKTTLVAQWLAGHQGDRAMAWVSLDAGDNDPGRLWTHVATALDRAGCVLTVDPVEQYISTNINLLQERVLPQMVSVLAAMPNDVYILLDDFHLVSDAACHGQVEFLLEHLPPRAHLVIITRADPGLRLGRLRASGRLGEIRAQDLCFTAPEVSELMAREQVALSSEGVTDLIQRTEGWPAGIYLARLWLSGKDDPDEALRQFSGGNRFIGDYLTEEVLSRHADETRDFIVTISFLDRFSAPLCDFVAKTTGSAAILQELERTNLFLMPLDEEGHWFRFHHLFAAVAIGELEADRSEQIPKLHVRAAEWLRDHDHIEDAVHHFLAGGDVASATELVQEHWMRYVDAGRVATVLAWLEALGTPSAASDPASVVAAAWMSAFVGDTAGLTRQLTELADVQDYGPLPDGIQSVESAIAMIQGLFGYGGLREMSAGALRAVELETDTHSPYYALATLTLGHATYVSGDLDQAATLLGKAAYNEAAPAVIQILSLATLSLVEGERGRLRQSGQLARAAMQIVDEKKLWTMPHISMAFSALGQAQADEGDLEAARETLEEGLALRRRSPEQGPWGVMHHLLVSARVAAASGRLADAQELVDAVAEHMTRFADGTAPMKDRLEAIQAEIRAGVAESAVTDPDPLTARELDVLRLLQGSLSLHDISREIYLSANTVKTHTNAVYRKLGAHSRGEAVRLARHNKLI